MVCVKMYKLSPPIFANKRTYGHYEDGYCLPRIGHCIVALLIYMVGPKRG